MKHSACRNPSGIFSQVPARRLTAIAEDVRYHLTGARRHSATHSQHTRALRPAKLQSSSSSRRSPHSASGSGSSRGESP
jgi:hypothetical protein